MSMLALSVTSTGLVIGALAWVLRGRLVSPLLSGVVGAWGGFAIGAGVGLLADVLSRAEGTGMVAGHLAAVGGAIALTIVEHRLATDAGPAAADDEARVVPRQASQPARGGW